MTTPRRSRTNLPRNHREDGKDYTRSRVTAMNRSDLKGPSVPAPDFSPGERVFKPAETLYHAMIGL
jgi:hypothetical protein